MNKYVFECINGRVYSVEPPNCLVCKHCDDIFCDYTNGPYMTICGLNPENDFENCGRFELENDAVTVDEFFRRINNG